MCHKGETFNILFLALNVMICLITVDIHVFGIYNTEVDTRFRHVF